MSHKTVYTTDSDQLLDAFLPTNDIIRLSHIFFTVNVRTAFELRIGF